MASLYYSDTLLLFILLLISGVVFVYRRRLPVTNWPILGMTPDIVLNSHRIHDFATDIVKLSNATFMIKGPWFANINMLITSDPSNIHYMLSKNFPNYPKGPEFRNMFDLLGDGIFNSDYELWEIHRRTTMSLLKHPEFQSLLETAIVNKVENGLLPILEFVSTRNQEIDLQEIFQRFTFDVICLLLLDYDPESLSIDLPFIPCEKAFTDAEEALLWRHVLPEKVWKLQKRFGLGKEKKMNEATKAFDEFIYKCMSNKHDEAVGMVHDRETGLLTSLVRGFEGKSGMPGDMRKFSRDTILSLMIAGRDTTSTALSWFFYLLAKNPSVESKIRAEIGEKWGVKELDKLIYLHGGICKPRDQGGLGIKDFGKWNEVLMAKHIWNVASNKESLWVKWINEYRLKGSSIWNAQTDMNASAGWKQMLSLRDKIRNHVYCQVGDGKQCSFWFDKWCSQGPLCNQVPLNSIKEAGLNCNEKLCDMVRDGSWRIPSELLEEYPVLKTIPSPSIDQNCGDVMVWVSNEGMNCKFTVGRAWYDLRQPEEKVKWSNLIWYSHCIPKHSFILWLTVQGRLTTQDRLAKWYPGRVDTCPLCSECNDSHGHLFFECKFSKEVWNAMKRAMDQQSLSYKWSDIIHSYCNLPNNKSIMSIVRRLVLAASVYFIWQERNRRLFGNEKRSWKDIVNVIMNTVRLKLLSLRVKITTQVLKAMERWRVDMQCINKEQVMMEWSVWDKGGCAVG